MALFSHFSPFSSEWSDGCVPLLNDILLDNMAQGFIKTIDPKSRTPGSMFQIVAASFYSSRGVARSSVVEAGFG